MFTFLFTRSLIVAFISLATCALVSTAYAVEGKVLGGKQTEYPDWFKPSFLDINEDIAEAGESNKLLAVLFVLNNCPYCHALVERNMSQQSIKNTLQKHFDVVLLNMRGDQEVVFADGERYTEKSLSDSLGVQFTPTLLFFDPQSDTPSEPVMRLNGYVPPSQFAQALSYLTSRSSLSFAEYRAQHADKRGLAGKKATSAHFLQPIQDLRSAANAPFALFFIQPDCLDCQAMYDKITKHPSLRNAVESLPRYAINIWSNHPITLADGSKMTTRAYAEHMNIQYAPTVVLFDAKGQEVIRSLWLESFHLESMLLYASSKSYQTMSFQEFLNQHSQAVRKTGKDVRLWD